ncbi:YndM family protein [Bacillus smithii]|uniref:YndM family protein n=1 Tax=Bacillus smithii TaxID=1479 RepID=UPI003D1F7106
MEHVKALIIKFVMVTIILAFVLGLFYRVDFGEYFTISLIVTVVSYMLSDLFILPRFGNTAATISDFVLAYILIWAVGSGIINENISLGWASFWSALILAIAEIFFHRYINKSVFNEDQNNGREARHNPAFSSEFGEEDEIVSAKDFRTQNSHDNHADSSNIHSNDHNSISNNNLTNNNFNPNNLTNNNPTNNNFNNNNLTDNNFSNNNLKNTKDNNVRRIYDNDQNDQ